MAKIAEGSRPEGYMPQLDSLRAIAVFGVFIEHYFSSDAAIRRLLPWGSLGVLLFFVLSGFLITRILLSVRSALESGRVTAGVAIRNFFARRFLRLMPIYYLVLLAAAVLLPHSRCNLWKFCIYSQNFLFASHPAVFYNTIPYFWSLAVEEQFYFTWPFLILFAPRRWLASCIVGVVLAGPAFRALGLAMGLTPFQVRMMMPAHFDTLGMGSFLAVVEASMSTKGRLLSAGLWVGWPLLVASLVGNHIGLNTSIHFLTLELGAGLAFAWLIGRAATGLGGVAGWVLNKRPLIYLGTISYGLYVYHYNVPGLLRDQLFRRIGLGWPESDAARFAICSGVSVCIASVSWWALERPINNLKHRFRYVPSGGMRMKTYPKPSYPAPMSLAQQVGVGGGEDTA